MLKLILEYIDKWICDCFEFAGEHPFLTIFMVAMLTMFLSDLILNILK
jgi:hypothetical protein